MTARARTAGTGAPLGPQRRQSSTRAHLLFVEMMSSVTGAVPAKPLVHLTGASGSGTSTLGRGLAEELGADVVDIDDLYWSSTDPPFTTPRPVEERVRLLRSVLERAGGGAVVSGSLVGWADEIIDGFDLIVFLVVPTAVRLARLRERELAARGSVDERFIGWAGQYDTGGLDMRSRALHEAWLAERAPPVLRIEGDVHPSESLRRALEAVRR